MTEISHDEVEGNWQPGDPTWGNTGVYGPKEPEFCDVAVAVRQAAWTANYPGGHPARDAAADATAADQTVRAYGWHLARQYAAEFQEPEPELEAG